MFRGRSTQSDFSLVAGEGFVFTVEIYGFFSCTSSTASYVGDRGNYVEFVWFFFTVKLVTSPKKSLAKYCSSFKK